MSAPWTPGPLKYGAGVLYVDRGIQPHVARITDGLPDADKWGALLAEAPAMADLLEELAVDLEAETDNRMGFIGETSPYPSENARKRRDMEPVRRARALLARVKGETT